MCGFRVRGSVGPVSAAHVFQRSENFIASFVGNFVDEVRDKACDKGPLRGVLRNKGSRFGIRGSVGEILIVVGRFGWIFERI